MLPIIAAMGIFFPTLSLPQMTIASDQDQRIDCVLREVINRGADLYNRGDANGCYRLYEGSLIAVRALAERHPDWQQAIADAFERAQEKPQVSQRAFVLRDVIDRIRGEAVPK